MAEYDETTYGERIAEVYDLLYGKRDNPETVADFLAPLAGKRRALELGIGTGRIAIPLAARGVRAIWQRRYCCWRQDALQTIRPRSRGDVMPATKARATRLFGKNPQSRPPRIHRATRRQISLSGKFK